MKIKESILLCLLFATLAACGSNAPPVLLTTDQHDYFGSWEHMGSEYGNSIVSDNMLLIFHPDSTVSYKRCINRMNGRRYTQLPGAKIESLSSQTLVISSGFWKLRWTEKLTINRPPYVEGVDMFLDIDGLKLRKLKDGESSAHESWKCSSEDDKKRDS
jgi:hypothetical protein